MKTKTKNKLMLVFLSLLAYPAMAEKIGQNEIAVPNFPNIKAMQDFLDDNDVPFAQLKREPKFALTPEEVKNYLPKDAEPDDPGEKLRGFSEKYLENLYGRLTPGPIPDGAYHGSVILPRKGQYEVFFQWAQMMSLFPTPNDVEKHRRELEKLMMDVWKGKTFDREHRSLINQLTVAQLPAFPAKLYCGQSFLDKNEESVIIDYAFGEDLPDYHEWRDKIATRAGVSIRDEIRMMAPGFYLGRAYMDGVFVLNFVLYQHDVIPKPEDCEMKIPAKAVVLSNRGV
jgi:hypothetical protein